MSGTAGGPEGDVYMHVCEYVCLCVRSPESAGWGTPKAKEIELVAVCMVVLCKSPSIHTPPPRERGNAVETEY